MWTCIYAIFIVLYISKVRIVIFLYVISILGVHRACSRAAERRVRGARIMMNLSISLQCQVNVYCESSIYNYRWIIETYWIGASRLCATNHIHLLLFYLKAQS